MNLFLKAVAIVAFAATSTLTQAATITIFVDGTMADLTGGSDNYGVDGTIAQFELTYDTASADVGSGVLPGVGSFAIFDAVSAELTVNGELYVLNESGLISVSNNYIINSADIIGTMSGQALDGSLSGLIMGDFVFELASTFFPGATTPYLPNLTNADINTVYAPLFEEDFTFAPQYDFVINGISVTVVPIPAAAWLFGSALIGLGWIRRKS